MYRDCLEIWRGKVEIIIRQQVEFRGLFVFDNEPATFEQIDLLVDGLEFFQQEKAPST